jgi:uncharacterized MAPEG superfamily protein
MLLNRLRRERDVRERAPGAAEKSTAKRLSRVDRPAKATPHFEASSRALGRGPGRASMTVAIWCILIAATLPYVAFGFVKGIDANQPRYHVGDLAGQSLRAYGAHLNGLETFPWFASAVIVSHMVGGPSVVANILAVIYILLRIGHMAAYIAGRQPLRSAAFTVAQFVALAIFISPLFR